MALQHQTRSTIAAAAVLAGLVIQNTGAVLAKTLFPVVGVEGMTALRTGIAACLLLAISRPWRRPPSLTVWPHLLLYGASLGLMNLLIYAAFVRIPIGAAVSIEVMGPLAVVVGASRTWRDLAWAAISVVGLWLLLWSSGMRLALDVLGVAFAVGAAACWAAYILIGKRVSSQVRPGAAVALGMSVAALGAVPLGAVTAGATLVQPHVLISGAVVALTASAVPYSLEMLALRRLPPRVFGLVVSGAPAVAALLGFALLGEDLTLRQWSGVLLVVAALAGSVMAGRDASGETQPPPPGS